LIGRPARFADLPTGAGNLLDRGMSSVGAVDTEIDQFVKRLLGRTIIKDSEGISGDRAVMAGPVNRVSQRIVAVH